MQAMISISCEISRQDRDLVSSCFESQSPLKVRKVFGAYHFWLLTSESSADIIYDSKKSQASEADSARNGLVFATITIIIRATPYQR